MSTAYSYAFYKQPPADLNYRTYNATTGYTTGDVVYHNGSTWMAIMHRSTNTYLVGQSGVTPTALTGVPTGNCWIRVAWLDSTSGQWVSGPSLTHVTFSTTEYFIDGDNHTAGVQLMSQGVKTSNPTIWSDSTTYASGSTVLYNGAFYVSASSLTNITPVIPGTTGKWIPIWLPWYYTAGQYFWGNSARNSNTITPGSGTYGINVGSNDFWLGNPIRNIYSLPPSAVAVTPYSTSGFMLQYQRFRTYSRGVIVGNGSTPLPVGGTYTLAFHETAYNVDLNDQNQTRWVKHYGGNAKANELTFWAHETTPAIWRNGPTDTTLNPGAPNTTGTEVNWSRVRIPGLYYSDFSTTYAKNEVIYDYPTGKYFKAYAAGYTNATPVSLINNVSNTGIISGWVPKYESGQGSIGDVVYSGTTFYVRVNLLGPDSPATPNTTGDGWVPVWDSSKVATYAVGDYLWYNGGVYRVLTSPPSTTTPDLSAQWETPLWDSTRTYLPGALVTYQSVKYIATSLCTGTDIPTSKRNSTFQGWLQVYGTTGTGDGAHQVGDYTWNNGRFYYAQTNNALSSTPTNTSNVGWVQLWHVLQAYTANEVVRYNDNMYKCLNSVAAGVVPTANTSTSSTWIPYFRNSVDYLAGQFVIEGDTTFIAATNVSQGGTIPVINNTSFIGWIPVWKAVTIGTYTANTYMYYGSKYYYALGSTNIHSSPPAYTTLTTGWVPLWTPELFATGQVVWHQPSVNAYIVNVVFAQVTDAPSAFNSTGTKWIPAYKSNNPYYPGNWVWIQGTQNFYMALSATLGTTPSIATAAPTSSTPSGPWATLWISGVNYNANSLVVARTYTNGLDFLSWFVYRTTGTTSIAATPPAYVPTNAYVRGMIVTYNSIAYACNSPQSAGSTPGQLQTAEDWIPVWNTSTTFSATTNPLTMTNAIGVYKLLGTPTSVGIKPNPMSTSSTGWVNVWNPTAFYLQNQYVEYNGAIYIAEAASITPSNIPPPDSLDWSTAFSLSTTYTNQVIRYNGSSYFALGSVTNKVPVIPNTTGLDWIPVWASGITAVKSSYVYYNGRIYFAQDNVDPLSTTAPLLHTVSANGWIPLWKSGVAIDLGDTVLDVDKVFSSIQVISAGDNTDRPSLDTTFTKWKPYWQAGTYTAGTTVLKDGREFVALDNVDGSTEPPSIKAIGKWVAKYKAEERNTYDVGDVVYHNSRIFIKIGAASAESDPVTKVTSIDTFVPVWTALDTYDKGNYVALDSTLYYKV